MPCGNRYEENTEEEEDAKTPSFFCRYVFHYNGATLFNPQFIDNPVPLLYGERPALLLAVSASLWGEMACVGLS